MTKPALFICDSELHRGYAERYLKREEMPFQVEIGPVKKKRSLNQNARLWLLHTAASEFTGYTPDEMHEIALCKHFGYTEVERKDLLTGEIINVRIPNKRSSTRDKAEFAKFMDATETWYGNDLGVWLPVGEYS